LYKKGIPADYQSILSINAFYGLLKADLTRGADVMVATILILENCGVYKDALQGVTDTLCLGRYRHLSVASANARFTLERRGILILEGILADGPGYSLRLPIRHCEVEMTDSGLLQISLFKEQRAALLSLEDPFPFPTAVLNPERVYRSQLRGSNGFSPFSLLILGDCAKLLWTKNYVNSDWRCKLDARFIDLQWINRMTRKYI